MATKYTLTTAFTAITETSGTIQNVGAESVELVSSTNAVAGEGIVLNPSEKRSFKGALSARSMGDAGAVVNVVDFTEAGEGGEEYVLPNASDTTLGGVKISNSFTVANDGTLNIKKAGKTILGAVKSSDDEGKVTVNNDATMTYNPVGYRQPSTTYEVGDIKYHSALPTGYYLECTTDGTSAAGELTISNPSVGEPVSDGTAVWIIQSNNNSLVAQKYAILGDANLCRQTGHYDVYWQNPHTNLPTTGDGGTLIVFRNSANPLGARVNQIYISNDNQQIYLRSAEGLTDADWTPWQLQESIVTKSLGINGFVKYSSGLIIQWGYAVGAPVPYSNTFPITFPNAVSCVIPTTFGEASLIYCTVASRNTAGFSLRTSNNSGNVDAYYIAIGY